MAAARPEAMNATAIHAKARVSLAFSDPLFVAGQHVTGKMELECRADKGLGMGLIKVELFAIQGALFNISSVMFFAYSLNRVDFERPLGNKHLPALNTLLPRSFVTSLQCRIAVPSTWQRSVASRLLPGS